MLFFISTAAWLNGEKQRRTIALQWPTFRPYWICVYPIQNSSDITGHMSRIIKEKKKKKTQRSFSDKSLPCSTEPDMVIISFFDIRISSINKTLIISIRKCFVQWLAISSLFRLMFCISNRIWQIDHRLYLMILSHLVNAIKKWKCLFWWVRWRWKSWILFILFEWMMEISSWQMIHRSTRHTVKTTAMNFDHVYRWGVCVFFSPLNDVFHVIDDTTDRNCWSLENTKQLLYQWFIHSDSWDDQYLQPQYSVSLSWYFNEKSVEETNWTHEQIREERVYISDYH